MSEFLSNQETHQLSPLNMCESQKQKYIHDLADVLSLTKFQLDQIRTWHFQSKLFDIAVTLIYDKAQWGVWSYKVWTSMVSKNNAM